VVFKLSLTFTGWKETVLHFFTQGTDGAIPGAGVIFDSAGNLYGTAEQGGNTSLCGGNGCGVVFKLSPTSGGWAETVLHTFGAVTGDVLQPAAGLVFDAAGNLYGATPIGGANGVGTVFEVTP